MTEKVTRFDRKHCVELSKNQIIEVCILVVFIIKPLASTRQNCVHSVCSIDVILRSYENLQFPLENNRYSKCLSCRF